MFSMRVISGKYRGRALKEPVSDNVRPTIDRVKEAVFGSLQFDIIDSNVLDLFAGSGSLGIECISRGAKFVSFVDKSDKSINIVKGNIKNLAIEEGYEILHLDCLNALRTLNKKYDIVFIDAPFDTDLATLSIELIDTLDVLNEGAKIIWERKAGRKYPISLKNLKVNKIKKYGTVEVVFLCNDLI